MRILLLTLYYYPDMGGTPGVYKDLCESLHSMGHDVVVVTGMPRYNITHVDKRYRHKILLTEQINGVEVRRIRTPRLPRYVPAARAMEYLLTAVALFLRALFTKRADVALVHSPILFEGFASVVLRKLKRMPFVLNVHDIFPQTAIDLGLLRNRAVIRFFQGLERYVYRQADCMTVHSPGNREWILARHSTIDDVAVMPIWMNVRALRPGSRQNAWRESHALNGKFVALFSGSQGYNQDMRVILKAAERLRSFRNIRFVLIGSGAQHDEMVELSKQMHLENVNWLDWQPEELYPLALRTADVVLVTLDAHVRTPVVPSKILSAMSAGRPVITCAPLSGDAPRIVDEAMCGTSLPPGDDEALTEAILRLYADRDLAKRLGANGRRYVEQYLNVDLWTTAYVDLFSHLLNPDGGLSGVLARISRLMPQENRQQRSKPLSRSTRLDLQGL